MPPQQGILIGEVRDGVEYFIGKLSWSERVEHHRWKALRHFHRQIPTVHTTTTTILSEGHSNLLSELLNARKEEVQPGKPIFTEDWVTRVLPSLLRKRGFSCYGPFPIDREERRFTSGGEKMSDTLQQMELRRAQFSLS